MDSDDFYVQYSGRSCNLSVQLCFHHSMHLCVSCVVCMCVCLSVCLSVWVFVVVGFVVVGLFVVVGFVVVGFVVVGFVALLFVVVASKRNRMFYGIRWTLTKLESSAS
jgi:hypothetical protein